MEIVIIDVGSVNTHSAKNGRQYQSLEITYKNDQGQAQSKKLMSFAAPEVFKIAQGWTKGDAINVSTEKDANGYWQWKKILGAGEQDTATQSTPSSTNSSTRVSGSNYPTMEERAQTQAYIIKQSSLSNAVATLAVSGKTVQSKDVIELANLYQNYVFGIEPKKDLQDIDDDLDMLT
tara:strand:- start:5938 stop:6468 length:531 start_codon:yes stop_codon:yes gene_type:complete